MNALHRKTLMKTLAAILLALTLSFMPEMACASGMPKPVVATTHRIEMRVSPLEGVCSSTAIGPHALLTATHCDLGASVVNVDGNPAAIVERIADGNDHTIYIVNIELSTYAKFSKHPVEVGDEVWLRGNPDGLNQLIRYGHYSGSIVNDGTVYYMFDINGWHGDSGSAIFDKHGKIVAVTSVGFADGAFSMIGTFKIAFTKQQLEHASK